MAKGFSFIHFELHAFCQEATLLDLSPKQGLLGYHHACFMAVSPAPSTFWSDEVVLIWVIAVIYVASFMICFVSLSRESCWFVYLSVKVDLSFDWPSHSLTHDPSLCFLPVCASLGHAPRGILRCVSDHWLVVIFSSHSFLLFMIFACI